MAEGFSKLFGTSFDDPRTQGILGLAGGLLEAGGYQSQPMTLGQALSYGGRQGMQSYQTALEAQRAEADRKLREQQLKQSMEIQAAQEARQAEAVRAKKASDLALTRGVTGSIIGDQPLMSAQLTPEQTRLASLAQSPELAKLIAQQQISQQFKEPLKPIQVNTATGVQFLDPITYEPVKTITTKQTPLPETKQAKESVVVDGKLLEQVFNVTTQKNAAGTVIGRTKTPVGEPYDPIDEKQSTTMAEARALFPDRPELQKQFILEQAEARRKGVAQKGGIVLDSDGKLVGQANYLPRGLTGGDGTPIYMVTQGGKSRPLQENERVIDRSTQGNLQLPVEKVNEYRADLTDMKLSTKKLVNYFKTVDDANVGASRVIDGMMATAKTFFNDFLNEEGKKLSPEELALRIANGQLQGLIGASRLDVVGPGVLTEQDALRVIYYLGGDITASQNPEEVAAAVRRVLSEKVEKYNELALEYNEQISVLGMKRKYIEPLEEPAIQSIKYRPDGLNSDDYELWSEYSNDTKREILDQINEGTYDN
jgi:hypothetical protein